MLQILAFLLPNAALISILFLPESTEGISAGQTTALIQDVVQDNSSDTIYSGNKEADDERIHEDISV